MNLLRFLNPVSPVGGWLGRVIAPAAVAASVLLAAPISPLELMDVVPRFSWSGVDISVYSGRIDQARWQAAGSEVSVVGAWHGGSANPYAEANLRDARNAGKITATYCVVTAYGSPAGHMDACKAAVGSEWPYLNFVAVDAETPGLTIMPIVEALYRVRALGGRPVLYSGCWFINSALAGQDLAPLSGWPYWNAHYDGDPDIDYPGCIPGAPLMGEQYEGSGTRWGIWSDINVFDDGFIREGYPFVGGPAPVGGCDPNWVPWPGYGLYTGWWAIADLNGDGRWDKIHVLDGYLHPWMDNGDCTWTVEYWGVP